MEKAYESPKLRIALLIGANVFTASGDLGGSGGAGGSGSGDDPYGAESGGGESDTKPYLPR